MRLTQLGLFRKHRQPSAIRRFPVPVHFSLNCSVQTLTWPCRHDEGALCCNKFHEFLLQTEYKNFEDPICAFQYAENIQLPFFPWMMQHPTKLTSFLTMPEDWRIGTAQWFKMFSTEELLFKGAKTEVEDSTLLVDVAGRPRYDIQTFKDRFANQPGLQDLPSVVNGIQELHPNVVRMIYDFFTKQPTKDRR